MADTPRTATAEEDALEAREPAGYRQSDASLKERDPSPARAGRRGSMPAASRSR